MMHKAKTFTGVLRPPCAMKTLHLARSTTSPVCRRPQENENNQARRDTVQSGAAGQQVRGKGGIGPTEKLGFGFYL